MRSRLFMDYSKNYSILIIEKCKRRGYSKKTINPYLFQVNKFIDSRKTPQD